MNFLDEINEDINWRISELASLKSLPLRYNLLQHHKDILIKYSVPSIYSVWEGFVKRCLTIYSHHLNSLTIKRNEIHIALLTHLVDSECDLNNPRLNFDSKQRVVTLIDSFLTDTIVVKPNIPTESNVNFKVLNKILERFCIEKVDEKYDSKLNKLLLFRNKIAHGENSISVTTDNLNEFINTVEDLMSDILINIEENEKRASYKKVVI